MVMSSTNYGVTETTMFHARAVRYACSLRHLLKHCQSDDNSLGEKICIKPHLKPQGLQGELIILIFFFLFNRMPRTKICSES